MYQATPSHGRNKGFYFPCLVHILQDRDRCIFPHLRPLSVFLVGGVLTHALPIHSHVLGDEDKFMTGCPWCGLSSSGDSGTNQVIWSPRALVPPLPMRQAVYFPTSQAAVMVVNLMPLKHSDASTHARTRAEPASQQNTGSCPRGSWSLLAGHTDSSWSAPRPFEESAKPQWVPKRKDGEMMTGFLRWWLTAARSHCGEKDRKQNLTIGRRPWKPLENKRPALNHSQQNNHKCRMRKRPNYEVLFAFYHCSQSKCLSLSIHKFEMPAQILKSNISNTSCHLKL